MSEFYNTATSPVSPDVSVPAKKLLSVFEKRFSPEALTKLARDKRFIQRSRKVLPDLFTRNLIACVGSDKEWTLTSVWASYRRAYRELRPYDEPITWGPYYDIYARPQFLGFAEALVDDLKQEALKFKGFSDTGELVKTLNAKCGITDVIPHDGSVVKVSSNALKATCYYIDDAALKLHASLSLSGFVSFSSGLTPGQDSERENLGDLKAAKALFILDAGYTGSGVRNEITKAGSHFLVKERRDCGLTVLAMQTVKASGEVLPAVSPLTRLKRISRPSKMSELPDPDEREGYDMIVTDETGAKFRAVKFRVRAPGGHGPVIVLTTSIPADALDLWQLAALYRARWQVEIFYRCLKGFCSLKGSRSSSLTIQKGMMLFSLIVAYLRIIAASVVSEAAGGLALSPKKVMHFSQPFLNKALSLLRSDNKAAEYMLLLSEMISEFRATMQKAKPSFINRKRGKYVGWIIDQVSWPPIKTDLGAILRGNAKFPPEAVIEPKV